MTQSRNNSWFAILPALLFPILLGLAVYAVIIGAIDRKLIDSELLTRYITGHPVSQVTTAMFLVGLAALLLVGSEVWDQFRSFKHISLHESRRNPRRRNHSKRLQKMTATAQQTDAADSSGDSEPADAIDDKDVHSMDVAEKVNLLQQRLFDSPKRLQKFYLWKRLNSALAYIRHHKTAGRLEDELKYLADVDADKKHERYSLVRILIWATPMLGFLGTVLGISEALGGIAVGADNDFQSMMNGLQSSLYVAFDTTALALTFSIVLMFGQFLSDRFESQLLMAVDDQARQQLNQFFTIELEREDQHLLAIRSMGKDLMKSTERLVEQQCSLWNHSIASAQAAWQDSMDRARQSARDEVNGTLTDAAQSLASEVAGSISKADQTLDRRIKQWQTSLSELSRKIADQHQKLAEQTESVMDAASQFDQVKQLQNNLLDFVKALPDSNKLSETSEKMATAIRLLEYRIDQAVEVKDELQNRRTAISSSDNELEENVVESSSEDIASSATTLSIDAQMAELQRKATLDQLKIVLPDDSQPSGIALTDSDSSKRAA